MIAPPKLNNPAARGMARTKSTRHRRGEACLALTTNRSLPAASRLALSEVERTAAQRRLDAGMDGRVLTRPTL